MTFVGICISRIACSGNESLSFLITKLPHPIEQILELMILVTIYIAELFNFRTVWGYRGYARCIDSTAPVGAGDRSGIGGGTDTETGNTERGIFFLQSYDKPSFLETDHLKPAGVIGFDENRSIGDIHDPAV